MQVARRAGGPWRIDAGHQLLYQPLMVKGSPPDEEPLGLLVGAVRRSVRQLLMSRIGARGLSMQQFWLLVGIAEHPCHSQAELAAQFAPCATGAVPPLAIFGVPIYADDALMREQRIAMPAGTHEDAVVVDTSEWLWEEYVQPITNLGRRSH